MSKKRILATVFVSGFFSFFVDAWLDGGWPDPGLSGLLVFVVGLLVISLAFIGFESMYESRKNR